MGLDLAKPPDTQQFPPFPLYLRGVWAQFENSYIIYPLWWIVSGTLSVLVNASHALPFLVDSAELATIVSCVARVKTVPTGAAVIVDVNKNGVTIFTTQANRPTIAIGANISNVATPDVTALANVDVLTIDVDQIGSTVAGADLVVVMKIKQPLVIP